MTFKEILKERFLHDLGFDFRLRSGIGSKFRITTKSPGILCGLIFVPTLLRIMEDEFFLDALAIAGDERARVNKIPTIVFPFKNDGDEIKSGDVIAEIVGDAEILLKAERHICDIISKLSGIATHTNKKVAELGMEEVFLLDTRKDDPLRRSIDKYAVRTGGARNHRAGLYDGTLIKDNDIEVFGGVKDMAKLPDLIFIVDAKKELNAVLESRKMGVKIVAITDTNADPMLVDYLIPGNDDSTASIEILIATLADAYAAGKKK